MTHPSLCVLALPSSNGKMEYLNAACYLKYGYWTSNAISEDVPIITNSAHFINYHSRETDLLAAEWREGNRIKKASTARPLHTR